LTTTTTVVFLAGAVFLDGGFKWLPPAFSYLEIIAERSGIPPDLWAGGAGFLAGAAVLDGGFKWLLPAFSPAEIMAERSGIPESIMRVGAFKWLPLAFSPPEIKAEMFGIPENDDISYGIPDDVDPPKCSVPIPNF